MADSRLFRTLPEATLRELQEAAATRRLRRGEQLFARGDTPHNMYMVLSGEMKLWRALEGGGVVALAVMGRGELVSTLSVVRNSTYAASASALTPVELVAWPIATVRSLLERDPVFGNVMLDAVVRVTQGLLERVDEMSAIPVQQRVARVLLRLAGDGDGDDGQDGGVVLILSRQDIAELASTTLHTVSRVMSGWARAGVVGGARGRVILHNLPALAEIAGLAAA